MCHLNVSRIWCSSKTAWSSYAVPVIYIFAKQCVFVYLSTMTCIMYIRNISYLILSYLIPHNVYLKVKQGHTGRKHHKLYTCLVPHTPFNWGHCAGKLIHKWHILGEHCICFTFRLVYVFVGAQKHVSFPMMHIYILVFYLLSVPSVVL